MTPDASHLDHVWGRLPFLGPMAVRAERERGRPPGRLSRLVRELWDRVRRAEHRGLGDLLDCIEIEVGPGFVAPADAGPAERALLGELGALEPHLRCATMNRRGNGSSTVPSGCAG